MLVAVIEIAYNCPVHDGKNFSGLEWFENETDLIQWLRDNTPLNFFVQSIWDDTTKKPADIRVEYDFSQHNVIEARLATGNGIVASVRRHPYGDKTWVIEQRNV